MAIVAVCGQCSKRYTLDDKFAGRQVKCRTCNSQFVVPSEDPTLLSAPAPEPAPAPKAEEDVLELRTEFRKRASMPTITEERPEEESGDGGGETRTLRRSKGTEKRGRSRYRRKSRWMLKSIVGVLVLAGLAIGAGMIFVPKNMAHKWQRTKAFWGDDFLGYLGDLFSVDMALEKGAEEPAADTPAEPAGPPVGSAVVLRGRITAVEPGVAGGAPKACAVTTADTAVYRVVLAEPSDRLAEIAGTLKDGGEGPAVAVEGALAQNGLDANKLTQVDAADLGETDAESIAGKPGFEVVPAEGAAPEAPDATPPAETPPSEPDAGDAGDE